MATRGALGTEATLLERGREIERLGALLARAQEGVGGLMLVEAPAGLGKSRLLRWAVARAQEAQMLVRRARGGEAERALSFGVVLQLLEGWLASAEPAEREEALAGVAALSLPVFEGRHWSLAAAAPGGTTAGAPAGVEEPAGGASHEALLHGLFWLVANLAARRPLLLAVDDAHWGDPVSLRFLVYLAQRIDELPVALLLAHRPGEGDRRELLEDLVAHPLAGVLRLAPLSLAAVGDLLAHNTGEEVGERFARACFEASAGNPFLAWAIVRALRDDGISPSDGNAAEIERLRPEMVGRQALVRISRLGLDAMKLASAAAVVGEDAPLAHVAEVAGLPAAAAATASDALAAVDVFAGADPVSFAHPLLRKAVYEEIPQAQRGLAHLRAAELLHLEGAAAEKIAGQLLSTPRSRKDWAIGSLRDAAGEALLRGNPASAVDYLKRLLGEQLSRQLRAHTLLELGRAEALLGRHTANAHIERALALIDDRRAYAQAQRALGDALYMQGDLAAAASAFERGLELMDDVEDELTRDLHAGYFSAASLDSTLAPIALRHIEPLLERPAGDETPTERAVLASLAAHQAITGVPGGEVQALARRAWGDGALLAEEGPEGWGWHLLTAAFGWTDALGESLAISGAVIELARRRGLLMAYATASYCAQLPTLLLGRIGEARALGESVLDARRFGWCAYPRTSAAVLADTLVEQDDPDGAERALEVLQDELYSEAADRAPALAARGRLRLLQGRAPEALADMLAAGEMSEKIGGVNPTVVAWRTGAALAAWQVGERTQTQELLEQEREIVLRSGAPTHRAGELRARARTVGAAREVELLREALQVLSSSEAELEHLRCLASLGSALRRSGLRAEARATLEQALETAHRFGARRIERIVHGELRVAGARPRRLRFSGPDSLTASERRVADMAAEGMGNRDIAQALFVTTRTIEQHLYNAYKKLGITSRGQLPGALAGQA